MNNIQTGLQSLPLGIFEKGLPAGLSWEKRLTAAAQAGYEFVEISIDDSDQRIARLDWGPGQRADLLNAVLNTGVPIRSMSLSAHRRFPLGSASARTRLKGLDLFKKAIEFTAYFGIRLIQVAGCDVYHEESDETSRAHFLEGLHQAHEWASSAGVMLALENWDVECVDTVSKAMWYVQHFNSPWFQLYVDVGNLITTGHDPVAELQIGRGHIAAVHLRDALPGDMQYTPFGAGRVPFAGVFSKLSNMDFRGLLVLALSVEQEPEALTITAHALDWVKSHITEATSHVS